MMMVTTKGIHRRCGMDPHQWYQRQSLPIYASPPLHSPHFQPRQPSAPAPVSRHSTSAIAPSPFLPFSSTSLIFVGFSQIQQSTNCSTKFPREPGSEFPTTTTSVSLRPTPSSFADSISYNSSNTPSVQSNDSSSSLPQTRNLVVPKQPVTAESSFSAQVGGNKLVHQYYSTMYKSPELVYRFYQKCSPRGLMSFRHTRQMINEKILLRGYGGLRAEITTVDAQGSLDGGVIVLVTGYLTGKDSMKNFMQTLFLAPQDEGFYVLNDVFRYVDEVDHEEERLKKVKELQDNVAAVNFTLSSRMRRDLMNQCKALIKQNEKIRKRASEGIILSLRESLKNCKDNFATCEPQLAATRSEIQKWHSAFESGPATPAGTTPDPGLVITYLQNLKSFEESLKEKLEKSKKREVAFIVTYAKREQKIADLKYAYQDLTRQLHPQLIQIRRVLLDPAIHEEFTRLKDLVEEKESDEDFDENGVVVKKQKFKKKKVRQAPGVSSSDLQGGQDIFGDVDEFLALRK